jgi:RNA polymerase sigma-70 factor (ECF subfamily)
MTDSFELFCSLVRAQRDALFRVASSILRNDADAEDAVSEATLKAYIHFGRLRRVESFKPWIMKILVNESYAIARKRKSFEPLDNIPEETGEVPLSPADSLALWNAVSQLPEEFRAVTVLFYYEDMSIKDIGKILRVPIGTVNSRLSRARERLRVLLTE